MLILWQVNGYVKFSLSCSISIILYNILRASSHGVWGTRLPGVLSSLPIAPLCWFLSIWPVRVLTLALGSFLFSLYADYLNDLIYSMASVTTYMSTCLPGRSSTDKQLLETICLLAITLSKPPSFLVGLPCFFKSHQILFIQYNQKDLSAM